MRLIIIGSVGFGNNETLVSTLLSYVRSGYIGLQTSNYGLKDASINGYSWSSQGGPTIAGAYRLYFSASDIGHSNYNNPYGAFPVHILLKLSSNGTDGESRVAIAAVQGTDA